MSDFPKRLGTPSTEYAAYGSDRREHTLRTDADGIARPRDEHQHRVADTHRLTLVTDPATDPMPAKSASKVAWAAYAVTQGMDEAAAEAATRDELIDQYGERLPVPTPDITTAGDGAPQEE